MGTSNPSASLGERLCTAPFLFTADVLLQSTLGFPMLSDTSCGHLRCYRSVWNSLVLCKC